MQHQISPQPIILTVPRRIVDRRLDQALALLWNAAHPDQEPLSRTLAGRLIREERVLLNGKATKPTVQVKLHDRIEVLDGGAVPADDLGVLSGATLEVLILFENTAFVVVNKPADLLVHPTPRGTTATLVHFLLARFPKMATVGESPLRPGIVHRLDRDTSGVLVVAKQNTSFVALKKLFHDRLIDKQYLALVQGQPKADAGIIDTPLFRASGALKRTAVTGRRSRSLPGNTRDAVTEYRVLKRFKEESLVLVKPKTGRTHQIRVHLASIGHPIVGDQLYGFKRSRSEKAAAPKRQLLHAWSLSFDWKGKPLIFTAPLPDDFLAELARIDPALLQGEWEALLGLSR